jgi:O-antigen/teichoic acid export membrane protein
VSDEQEQRDLALHVRGAGRGTLATVLTRVADVGATYGYYAILAHALSTADFGRFILALTVVQIAAAVARRGLDQALLALPPGAAANRLAMTRVGLAALGVSLAGAIVYAAWPSPLPSFVLWLIGGLPIVALSQIVIGALRARGSVSLAATAESVSQPVSAFLFATIVIANSPDLSNFAIAFILSWAVPLLFAAGLEWRGAAIERDAAARLLTAGTSMLGVFLFQQAGNSADVLLLGVAASPAEVAHYAVAQKIAAAFLLLHGAVTNAAAPFVRRIAADHRLLAAFRRMVTRWSVSAGVPLLVVTAGVPSLLLRLFGAEYVAASAVPLAILSFAGVAYLVSGPAGTILLCTGQERVLFRVTAAGTVVLILCVAGLAPYGATGTAAGVLAGTLLTRGLLIGMLRRYASLAPADASLMEVLGAAAAGILVARLSTNVLGEIGAAALGIALAAAVAILILRREGDLAFLRSELG